MDTGDNKQLLLHLLINTMSAALVPAAYPPHPGTQSAHSK